MEFESSELIIEAIGFLIKLCEFGNQECQKRILGILKSDLKV